MNFYEFFWIFSNFFWLLGYYLLGHCGTLSEHRVEPQVNELAHQLHLVCVSVKHSPHVVAAQS